MTYKIAYFFFVIILMSTFSSNIPHLLFSILLIFFTCLSRIQTLNYKVNKLYLIPLILFVISTISTLIWNIQSEYSIEMSIFRWRKLFFELIVCYSVLFFCINSKIEQILSGIKIAIGLSVFVGIIQMCYLPADIRPSMLFLEPSSAGYFIGTFIFYLLVDNRKIFNTLIIFIPTIVLRSKSLFLTLIVTFVIFKMNIKWLISVFIITLIFGVNIHLYLMGHNEQYVGFVHLLNMVWIHGIAGFSSKFDIYNTYLTRLSSIIFSIKLFYENPLGIGFGSFHHLYASQITTMFSLDDLGTEVSDTLKYGMITPKSNMFEQLLSGGYIMIIILFYWTCKMFENKSKIIRMSVISFLSISFFTELNNFYLYVILLSFLSIKSSQNVRANN